ncbi:MAG: hypothetical protein ACRD0D_03645 [Acidimicrobiales bacterium]
MTETRQRELLAEEERLWNDLHGLIDSLTEDEALEPGYFPEGGSAKDVLAHIGSWLAEAGIALQQIRSGTYRENEVDIDALNEQCVLGMRELTLRDVRLQSSAARNRLCREWAMLPAVSSESETWVRKAGPDHYAEHLPRLREWIQELRARDRRSRSGAEE